MKKSLSIIKFLQIRFVILLSILISGLNIQAQISGNDEAREYATAFFNSMQANSGLKSSLVSSALTQSYQSESSVKTPLFVFQQADNGFVIVAQSHNAYEVVGYSEESTFDAANIPPQLNALMAYYEDSLQFINPRSASIQSGTPVVSPLLYDYGIRLNQFEHPEVGGCPSGCVATAVTQMMWYQTKLTGKPIKGYGSYCYTDENHGEICTNFSGNTYTAAELLSFHVGNSMEMQYCGSAYGSYANIDFPDALEEHFKYYVADAEPEDYYIKNELEHKRPIYTGFTGSPASHALVIDGYDSSGYYHVNFGWGGSYNGYYLLNNAKFIGIGNFRFSTTINSPRIIVPAPIPVNRQDSLALVAIHNAMGGYEATTWDLSEPVYKWKHVLLMNERVIKLSINTFLPPSTSQSIPSEIGNLTALRELSLTGCFNGNIPYTISNLTELKTLEIVNREVYVAPTLYKGTLKGEIPSDINKLTQLESLRISNAIKGTIPSTIGSLTNLKSLQIYQDTTYFAQGSLTGQIPSSIGNLSHLQTLSITDQQLSGIIPASVNNLSEIKQLDLSGNQLSGSIPALNLANLQYLVLDDNILSEFEEGNSNCPDLEYVYLQDNIIAGDLPSYFGNYTSLISLNLSDNQITSIPEEIGNLIYLENLSLDDNQLQILPNGLGLCLSLRHFTADNNQIETIPENFGQEGNLETLHLSNNQIKSIPPEIGNNPDLYEIYFNSNKIDSIPSSFANIRESATILLQDNEMTGNIPEELMNISSEKNRFVRLDSNRFVFSNIPKADDLQFGVRNQREVLLKKQVFKVQVGDTVHIDIRSISGLSDPGNKYYWLTYPNLTSATVIDERFSAFQPNPVLEIVINEENVNNKYYCKVFNPESPTYTFIYENYTHLLQCMEYLNTDTIVFQLASDEEIIAEKYSAEFVTSLQSLPDKTINDGTITLVPPVKIKRGTVYWEASSDGETWEIVSESMERADLQANIKSSGSEKLVLTPKNTAFYRCCINEDGCDPLYSDPLKVESFGNVLFDQIINVTEESLTVSVDSIEVVVPQHFHDTDFRMTITKLDNPPASPDSMKLSSVYDVSVSCGSVFDIPLLIKFKNIDLETFNKMDIDKYVAVYYDDRNQKWEPYENSGLSLKDSSIEFYTNHLTKLAWYELAHGSFTYIHTRDRANIIYKQDYIFDAYKITTKQPWHTSNIDPENDGTPYMIQDMGEYMDQIINKFDSLGLKTPGLRFNVYVESKLGQAGKIDWHGYIAGRGYFYANPIYCTDPSDLRRTISHEYMHYTQDYYMTVTLQNYWWQEAHAPLSDRLVWDDNIQKEAEPEYLLKAGYKHSANAKSIFEILSNSWYDDNNIPILSKYFTDSNDPNLAGTFLHYMRSYRTDKKLEPDVLLKETPYLGTWVGYLDDYAKKYLNSTVGNEYEDFVKYIISGDTLNFTIINKSGNPYSYLESSENTNVFTYPVSYYFKEGDEIPQKDEMDIKVPNMASKIVLLKNFNPDTMVLVNYKRKHNIDENQRVYFATYDYKKKGMIYTDISDSTEYNFLLDARNKENILTKFSNYSFLLLINKNSSSTNFDASFELTASPVMNIKNVAQLAIYSENRPMKHTFDNTSDYLSVGSPNPEYMSGSTFNAKVMSETTTKEVINDHTLRVINQYTLIIDEVEVLGAPTVKDSTIYTQTIDYDILDGTLKINEQSKYYRIYHTYFELSPGSGGEVEKILRYKQYIHDTQDKTITYWLKDFMNYQQPENVVQDFQDVYGTNINFYLTNNTSDTRKVVNKIDGYIKTTNYTENGTVSSVQESTYVETDYSNPDLKLYFILRTKDE